jgi:hypothetical protein
MTNRSVTIELPEDIWKIIDTNYKITRRENSDSQILCNIIKSHLAEHGYYPDLDSFLHGHELKDDLDIQEAMMMSIVDLLERKGLATYQDWAQIIQERIIRE